MTGRMVWALGLTLVLAAPGLAGAVEVRLTIKDGRVALVARDATLRDMAQHLIADGITETLVDRAKAAQVDQRHVQRD